MKDIKKSPLKKWAFLVTGIAVLLIALFRHPSFKPMLSYTQKKSLKDLTIVLDQSPIIQAQELWKFREFYSRGTITLSKFDELYVPSKIVENYDIPVNFSAHTLFESSRVQSIEGLIPMTKIPFLTDDQAREKDLEIRHQSENLQILRNKTETSSLIIGVFDLETASQANGYLYFDMRDDEFVKNNQDKKWLVVSFAQL